VEVKPLKTIEFGGPSENTSSSALKELKPSLSLFAKDSRDNIEIHLLDARKRNRLKKG